MTIQNTIQDLTNLKDEFETVARQAERTRQQAYETIDKAAFYQFNKKEDAYELASSAASEESVMKRLIAQAMECLDTLEAIKSQPDSINTEALKSKVHSSLTEMNRSLHFNSESRSDFKQDQYREFARKVNKISAYLPR